MRQRKKTGNEMFELKIKAEETDVLLILYFKPDKIITKLKRGEENLKLIKKLNLKSFKREMCYVKYNYL